MRAFTLPLLGLMMALSGCGSKQAVCYNETTIFSQEAEIALGDQHFPHVVQLYGAPFAADPKLSRYVQKVGTNLAQQSVHPELPWEFVILNHAKPLSWSLPGGKVAVSRGLLRFLQNEDELAAVLAHEIAHVAALHASPRLETGVSMEPSDCWLLEDELKRNVLLGKSSVAEGWIQAGYSWEDEREADRLSIQYLDAAGYDSRAASTLQTRIAQLSREDRKVWKEGFERLHPISSQRMNRLLELSEAAGVTKENKEFSIAWAYLRREQDAYDRIEMAREYLRRKEPLNALSALEDLQRRLPREADVFGLRGQAYLDLDQFSEAEKALSKAIILNRNHFVYLLKRGLNRYQNLQDPRASTDLSKANQLLPTSLGHYALGQIALSAGNVEEGVLALRRASSAASVTATKARRQLALMELSASPERYLEVKTRKGRSGQLCLEVHNRGPVDVRDLVVQVESPGPHGPKIQQIRMNQLLKSGQRGELNTSIPSDRTDLSWEIQNVRVVE